MEDFLKISAYNGGYFTAHRSATIHPTAAIRCGVRIGKNTVIGVNVGIDDGAIIGNNVVIQSGCNIGTDAIVGHGVVLQNTVRIENEALVQGGCVIGTRSTVARNSPISRGTIVPQESLVAYGVVAPKNIPDPQKIRLRAFGLISHLNSSSEEEREVFNALKSRVFHMDLTEFSNSDYFIQRIALDLLRVGQTEAIKNTIWDLIDGLNIEVTHV